MKFDEKIKAVSLRKLGKSYNQIAKKLNVSKGTLSLWLQDIKLTSFQMSKLKGRQMSGLGGGKINHKKRIEITKEIIKKSKMEVKSFFTDPLFLSGLMLYWAEGDKTNEKVKFSNSDPIMIKLMMRWFRKICDAPKKKIRVALHIHELHCRKNIENYWSKVTRIPLNQFHKIQIKPTSLGQRRNRLYNGTCAIIISDRNLFRKIKGWKLGFIEGMKIR